ncbi:hypothetical protein EV677_0528 [Herminiimonas fonticola]|uniref:Uncharacterized protein n=1 Tax=Herminiimonas fonticola TaxID=303380 RepID=A0A4V3BW90_9BURK|nr:hypothetical protein Hfont_0507 [Herminiimonas fonticola]TDN93988.1 hypothetical protein EV677_0528 [Herminiimonas fonticola]
MFYDSGKTAKQKAVPDMRHRFLLVNQEKQSSERDVVIHIIEVRCCRFSGRTRCAATAT